MNKWTYRLFLCVCLLLVGCGGDDDLLPEYMIDKPKVLAVVVRDPETVPGSDISTRLLVGGRQVDQEQEQDVNWLAALETPQFCVAAYNDTCTLTIPAASELADDFSDSTWFDIPVFAQTTIEGKNYYGEKVLRISYEPIGKNPEVEAIEVAYIDEDHVNQDISITEPGDEIRFQAGSCPVNIAFTATPAVLDVPEANDNLVYRWKVSLSKDGGTGRLYTNTDADDVQEILGEGIKAADYRQSVVFSLRGEDLNDGIQYGRFDIYLIVRDQASNAQDRSEDRLGMTFFYFTLVIDP